MLTHSTDVEPRSPDRAHPLRPGLAAWAIALLPALAAIWSHPAFMTQDGAAHLYNAQILAQSFRSSSPYAAFYDVRWEPLPNWAGHLALIPLVTVLPPRAADRVMTTLTLLALSLAVLWLRGEGCAGSAGIRAAAVLAVMLGLNVTWLFGFASFLLGASLFPVTLGVWWSGRESGFRWRSVLALAMLTTLGYFCHLVSLGLTVAGVCILEALTPGRERRGRALATAIGLIPVIPLGALYLALSRRGGGMSPRWQNLPAVFSLRAWLIQLTWADPISLARKTLLPLGDGFSAPWCVVFAPVLWLLAGLIVATVATWRVEGLSRSRRAWWVLAALLLIGGVLGPDTLGAGHGHYLPQRVILLGLAALVPVVRFGPASSSLLGVALVLQSLTVWDYAQTSQRTAGRLLRAAPALGNGQRVATLLINIRPPFRANPLLHADCALGAESKSIIWGNYETRFYYFPVHFRPGLGGPDPAALEAIAMHDAPAHSTDRARLWRSLLERHHPSIDRVIVWGRDPALEAVNARWFVTSYEDGPVRVLRAIEPGPDETP